MNDKIFCTEDGFAVKTLFLKSLPRDFQADRLFDYFSVFGSVQSARIHVRAADSFGFVKFDDAKAAAKAFKMKHHAIDGCNVEVRIADNYHQDEPATNDELRIELTNATGTEFMDLNDDCLREIFTHLTDNDLCSLAELSAISKINRLEAVTNEIFSRKYSKSACANNFDEADRLFINFGWQMSCLSMDGSDADSACSARRLQSIIQCCSGTLERLYLSNYTIGENETKAMKTVFSNLRELRISNCSFEGDAADLFASCTSLHTLYIHGNVPNKEAIFQHTFSNLSNFVYGDLSSSINYNLDTFFSRHKSLKCIQLLSTDDHSDLLPIIEQNCCKLQALAISIKSSRNTAQTKRSLPSLNNLEKFISADDDPYGDSQYVMRFIQEYIVNSGGKGNIAKYKTGEPKASLAFATRFGRFF